MKKVLFATTALVATRLAVASSPGRDRSAVTAEMGIWLDGQRRHRKRQFLQPTSDCQASTMSTEADNGMKVGARLRHQVTKVPGVANAGGWGFNTARFYATMGGLTVAVGNIGGAIEFMPGLYLGGTQSAGVGLSGLGFTNLVTNTNGAGYWGWDAYSSGGTGSTNNDGVEIIYSQGDFGAHLSHSAVPGGGEERTALHLSYSMNGWTVALGMQDSSLAGGANDKTVLTARGALGNTNLQIGVADNNGVNKWMLGANFEVGAATRVDAFVTSEDGAAGGETWGLGVSHSLGGGVSIEAGVVETTAGTTMGDLGIRFNF